ncbi:MAG: response regulator [Bacteroidales bacterium]|nr:response regulator [Bacteroidales bacterium]
MMKFNRLKSRITFWFLVIGLFPVVLAVSVIYVQRIHSIHERSYEKLTTIRDLKMERLNNWIFEREGDLKTASADKELEDIVYLKGLSLLEKRQHPAYQIIHRILNRYLDQYKAYDELFILDPVTGAVVVSSNQQSDGDIKKMEEYFTMALSTRNLYIQDIYYSKTLNHLTMAFSIPIFNPEKEIIGIMVARVNLDESLYPLLLDRVGLGETGETLIVDEKGLALNELRWYENAPLNLYITAAPAMKAAAGETGIIETGDYRNKQVLAAYGYISKTGWGFVCKQDISEVNAPINPMLTNFLIILLVSFIVVFLSSRIVARSLTQPIAQMKDVAVRISEGDLSARNEKITADELGVMATAFNYMADAISKRFKVKDAVSEISGAIVKAMDINNYAHSLLVAFADQLNANLAVFYVLNEQAGQFEHFCSIGAIEKMLTPFRADNPEGEMGLAVSTKQIQYIQSLPYDTMFSFRTSAGNINPKELITIPLVIDDTVIALISIASLHPFPPESIEIVKEAMPEINATYANMMANERTRVLAEDLKEMNWKLKSQSEELQSQSEELHMTSEELQEQNMQLEIQSKEVEEANRLKSEFLANMSHELRTPLNSILTLSRVLIRQAKEKLDDEENNYLEIVERNGKQLLNLINDILDLSKIEAGRLVLSIAPVNLKNILTSIKESLNPLAAEKDLKITLNAPRNLPKIQTDENRLIQVLSNIIGNSVKFTNQGGIDIDLSYNSREVQIDISDTGVGIPDEELSTIFDEFTQVDGSSTRQFSGTGLGLAIVDKLVSALEGEIRVTSKVGEGTVFTVILPIHWPGGNLFENDPNNSSAPKKFKKLRKKRSHDIAPTILIVEDNTVVISQMKQILSREGFSVAIAEGGEQAINYMREQVPDGIILDLMMPGMDGFEVLDQMRSTEETANIPVLILTAKDLTKEDLSRLRSNNIQQLVQKGDIDMKGLLKKISFMLGEPVDNNGEERPGILLIEDNPEDLIALKSLLIDANNLRVAKDVKSGLEEARKSTPDLILVDLSLPKEEYIKTIERIVLSDEAQGAKVIVITAWAMKEDQQAFLDTGCDYLITKPIDPDEFIALI